MTPPPERFFSVKFAAPYSASEEWSPGADFVFRAFSGKKALHCRLSPFNALAGLGPPRDDCVVCGSANLSPHAEVLARSATVEARKEQVSTRLLRTGAIDTANSMNAGLLAEGRKAMRSLIFLAAAAIGATATQAQTNTFYAERGYWLVASNGMVCRATDRPPADFNFAPFNALQIAVRSDNSIGAEVFFWPKALDPARDYVLSLSFDRGDALRLKAKPTMGDFMLASEPDQKLWRSFQDATGLTVAVDGEPTLKLYFGLDDMTWVLNRLQSCGSSLPKQ
jgi:hypothetical protein